MTATTAERVTVNTPDPKKFSGAGRTVHLSTRWALDPSSGGEPKTLHSTTVFTIDGQTAGPAETLTELGAIRWLLTICHQQARPATAVEVYLDESKEWAPAYSRRLMSPSRWAGTPEARPALARLNDLGDDPLNPWIDLANAVPRFPGVLAFPFDTGPLPFEADLLAMGSALEAWGKRLNKAGVLPRQRPWPVSIAASVLTGNNAPLARPWGCQFWQAYLGMKHQFTVGAPREGNATVTVARLVLAASLLSMVSGRPEAAARFVGSPSSKQALAELDALGIVQRHRLECLKCK